MILIDNYDSFTYNLVQYLRELGTDLKIFENDKITIDELKKMDFEKIIISPGAGTPDTAGVSIEVIKEFHKTKKILGVCLGHQCIAQFFGAKIVKAQVPVHGKTSKIIHNNSCLFYDIPQEFNAARYHSLLIEPDSIPECLNVTAKTKDNIIMAIEHKNLPIYGVQFHPEAILTEYGKQLLENFMK